jgi:hypothetical protein
MKSKLFFLISGLLAAGALACIVVPFNGSISVNAGFPVNTSTTVLQVSGATKGWPVLLALVLLIAAIVLFVTAVIRWLWASPEIPQTQAQGPTV